MVLWDRDVEESVIQKQFLMAGWTGSCIINLYRVFVSGKTRLQRNGFWLQEHGLHFSSTLFTSVCEAETFSWILMFYFSSRAKISSCHGLHERWIVMWVSLGCREGNNDGYPKIILMHTIRVMKRNNSGLYMMFWIVIGQNGWCWLL